MPKILSFKNNIIVDLKAREDFGKDRNNKNNIGNL